MIATIPVQFQGLQEGVDPKAMQPPGTLLKADNCRMDKARRLRKRGGTTLLNATVIGGGSIIAGTRLFETDDGGLGMSDGTSLYTYSQNSYSWRKIARDTPFTLTRRPLLDNFLSPSCVDTAIPTSGTYNTWLVSVWMSQDSLNASGTATIYVQVQDIRTWEMVLPPTQVDTAPGIYPKLCIFGNTAWIFYVRSSQAASGIGDLLASKLDLATLNITTQVRVVTGGTETPIDVDTDNSFIYVVRQLSAGVDRIEVRQLDPQSSCADTVRSPVQVSGSGTPAMTACCIDGGAKRLSNIDDIVVTYGGSAGVSCTILAASTLVPAVSLQGIFGTGAPDYALNPTQVFGLFDQATGDILVGHASGGWMKTDRRTRLSTTLPTTNSDRLTPNVVAMSRPFRLPGGQWYTSVLTYVTSVATGTLPACSRILVEIRADFGGGLVPHAHAGTLEDQTGWSWRAGSNDFLPTAAVDSQGNVFVASSYRHEERPAGQPVAVGWNINKLALTSKQIVDATRSIKAGATRMLVAPAPRLHDGPSAYAYGFVHAPEISAVSTGTGGAMATGVYQYAACFVWYSATGQKCRSPLSEIVATPTVAASGTVTLTFDMTGVSAKILDNATGLLATLNEVYIEIYRSEVNLSILHRRSFEPVKDFLRNYLQTTGGVTNVIATLLWTDSAADANILGDTSNIALSTQPQPYTDIELDDTLPPGCTTGTVHKDRFFIVDTTEFTVWASKTASDDLTVAPGFHEELTIPFARRKTALATLDDKLVAWDTDGIDAVFGDGPDANGQGAGWAVSRIQTDVGCTNPRSVVRTPMGALFQSRRGIELLSRDLTVAYIGKVVEDELATFPYITSAVLCEKQNEVRFTCNDGIVPNSGMVLVWDYLHNVWFTRHYARSDGQLLQAFADAIEINGTYYLLATTGEVYVETFTDFRDRGTIFVTRDIQLAPFEPASSPLGWGRVRDVFILTTSKTPHKLEVSASFDFSGTWDQVETFAEGSDATYQNGATNKARVNFLQQKVQSLGLRIRDVAPVTILNGEGPIFESLAFRADVAVGPARATDGESM